MLYGTRISPLMTIAQLVLFNLAAALALQISNPDQKQVSFFGQSKSRPYQVKEESKVWRETLTFKNRNPGRKHANEIVIAKRDETDDVVSEQPPPPAVPNSPLPPRYVVAKPPGGKTSTATISRPSVSRNRSFSKPIAGKSGNRESAKQNGHLNVHTQKDEPEGTELDDLQQSQDQKHEEIDVEASVLAKELKHQAFWKTFREKYPNLSDSWENVFRIDESLFDPPAASTKDPLLDAFPQPNPPEVHDMDSMETLKIVETPESPGSAGSVPESGFVSDTEDTANVHNLNLNRPAREMLMDTSGSDGEAHDSLWRGNRRLYRIQADIHDYSEPKNDFDDEVPRGWRGPKPDNWNSNQQAPPPPHEVVTVDLCALRQSVEEPRTAMRQTAAFRARSNRDNSTAVGVADASAGEKRQISPDSRMPQDLCETAGDLFEQAWGSRTRASTLMDRAYREVSKKEDVADGCSAAVFAVVSPRGKTTVSVLKDAGAVWIRNGHVFGQTETKAHPDKEPFVTVPVSQPDLHDDTAHWHVFDMFTDKLDCEWATQRGDVLLLFSADVFKYSKPKDFAHLVSSQPDALAIELAQTFLGSVVRKIRRKQIALSSKCSCWPTCTDAEEFPTDLSVVVVKYQWPSDITEDSTIPQTQLTSTGSPNQQTSGIQENMTGENPQIPQDPQRPDLVASETDESVGDMRSETGSLENMIPENGTASIHHLSQAEDADLDYQTAMSDSFPHDETDSDGKLASYRGLYDLSTLEGQEGETAKASDGISTTEARLFMVDETTPRHEKITGKNTDDEVSAESENQGTENSQAMVDDQEHDGPEETLEYQHTVSPDSDEASSRL
ncbi:hypothetical protein OXX69_007778 [Metschnikowia pulcherrima]